ncbi:hypothetical protein Btru_071910 [Bulinus truncatus]|nr:hypothetical protein Btru_071910 [Bulinus truncatus]
MQVKHVFKASERPKDKENIKAVNDKELGMCQAGDAIKFRRKLWRFPYFHWAVYMGNKQVIHLWGERGQEELHKLDLFMAILFFSKNFLVRRDSVDLVILNGSLCKSREKYLLGLVKLNSSDTIKKIAEGKIKQRGYSLFFYNCEHFVNTCLFNKQYSDQILKYPVYLYVIFIGVLSLLMALGVISDIGWTLIALISGLIISIMCWNFKDLIV